MDQLLNKAQSDKNSITHNFYLTEPCFIFFISHSVGVFFLVENLSAIPGINPTLYKLTISDLEKFMGEVFRPKNGISDCY